MNIFGSHDSLSSYPLKNWWVAPFVAFSRCQSKNLQSQLKSNVRYFDLRFRKVNGKIYAAHGIAIFDITIEDVFYILNDCEDIIFVRAMVEDGLFKDELTKSELINKINMLKSSNIKIHFVGYKSDWSKHSYYNYIPYVGKNDYNNCKIDEKIKELNELTKKQFETTTVIECYTYKGIIPSYSAKKINKALEGLTFDSNAILFKDFV